MKGAGSDTGLGLTLGATREGIVPPLANREAPKAGTSLASTNSSSCYILVEAHQTSDQLLPYLPSLTSGALVVAGWIVVNKMQANRERRKQIRDFVSGQMKDLTELEKTIVTYHTAKRDESAEQTFLSKLTRFEKSCALLPKFVESQRVAKATSIRKLQVDSAAIQRMRKAMTLKHFLGEHDGPVAHTDGLIKEIENATTEVQDSLEDVRLAALD